MTGLIVVAGPTASGKSALALRLAEAERGVIINADSMQLYRDLRVLTARPTPEDQARAPHRLYGILDAADPASAGRWLQLAGAAIGEALAARRPAIVVGGTGLYLHALLHGLAPVPDSSRRGSRRRPGAARRAGCARHFMPSSPRWIPPWRRACAPSDGQRLLRAYEVVVGTGRSLAAWQAMPPLRVDLPAAAPRARPGAAAAGAVPAHRARACAP